MPNESNKTETYLEDLKDSKEAIELANNSVKYIKNLLDNILKQYNLNDLLLDHLAILTVEEIDKMTPAEIGDFLESHNNDKYALEAAYLKNTTGETKYEFSKNALKGIREMYLNYMDVNKERMNLLKEAKSIHDNYNNYINSDKYKENRNLMISAMEKKLESMDDCLEKRKLQERIEVLKTAKSCAFILDRFTSGDPKKEADSVIKQFFDDRLSSSTLTRFREKSTKFNISGKVFRSLYNLEERFLSEEYHPFNNLFLYYIARFVVHCDPSDPKDKNKVEELFINLIRLSEERLSDEDKNNFIKLMKGFYMYIVTPETTEKFKEKNTTYKNHPKRLEEKNKLISDLKKELGPTYDESYENYDEASIRETLFRLNQSDILMTREVYRKTQDSAWIMKPHPFYEIKEKYDQIKKEEAEAKELAKSESDEETLNESTEEATESVEE